MIIFTLTVKQILLLIHYKMYDRIFGSYSIKYIYNKLFTQAARIAKHNRQTGAGPCAEVLSAVEEKVVDLIGREAIEGYSTIINNYIYILIEN